MPPIGLMPAIPFIVFMPRCGGGCMFGGIGPLSPLRSWYGPGGPLTPGGGRKGGGGGGPCWC